MMGITSNEVKQRWNAEHYTQVKVSVPPEIAAGFKARCAADGVSMASEISSFMSGQKIVISYETRQRRRKAILSLIERLEAITEAEKTYMDNIPENLRNSQVYETAEETVSALEEALGILEGAY